MADSARRFLYDCTRKVACWALGVCVTAYFTAISISATVDGNASGWPYAWLLYLAGTTVVLVCLAAFASFKVHKIDDAKMEGSGNDLVIDDAVHRRPVVGKRPTHRMWDDAEYAAVLARGQRVVLVSGGPAVAKLISLALEMRRDSSILSAFWEAIDVVLVDEPRFTESGSQAAQDGRSVVETAHEASTRAREDRHAVETLFLNSGAGGSWRVCVATEVPPASGLVLEMADGSVEVVLRVARPRGRPDDGLAIEFPDPDRRYLTLFRAIVASAREHNELVLVGEPHRGGLLVSGTKLRSEILRHDPRATGTVPAIVVILTQRHNGIEFPLLQVNTPANSTRELSCASHASGYVNAMDLGKRGAAQVLAAPAPNQVEIRLTEVQFRRTALREYNALGGSPVRSPGVDFVREVPFYYSDNENLHFGICHVEVPEGTAFPTGVGMCRWTIEELARLRLFQALSHALRFIEVKGLTREVREAGTAIVRANLAVHGEDLGGDANLSRLERALESGRSNSELRKTINRRLEGLATTRKLNGKVIGVSGLAGLQYREFFNLLVPVYAKAGVPGAEAWMDSRHREAVERLASLYADERLMSGMPLDL